MQKSRYTKIIMWKGQHAVVIPDEVFDEMGVKLGDMLNITLSKTKSSPAKINMHIQPAAEK